MTKIHVIEEALIELLGPSTGDRNPELRFGTVEVLLRKNPEFPIGQLLMVKDRCDKMQKAGIQYLVVFIDKRPGTQVRRYFYENVIPYMVSDDAKQIATMIKVIAED